MYKVLMFGQKRQQLGEMKFNLLCYTYITSKKTTLNNILPPMIIAH